MYILDDQHYIKIVLAGNTHAFVNLVDKYKDLVFTLALKMLNQKEDAEEIAQDTFIKVFKNLHQYKSEAKFSTWIYRIAYNTCLDKIRKNKNEKSIETIENISENEINSISNIIIDIDKKERKLLIKNCLNLLSKEDHFLLTLFHFEDLSLKEISSIMGITTNHVKIKLYRARMKLATILKENLEPEIMYNYES